MEAELPADIKEKGKDETVTDSQRQNDHPQTIEVELKVTFTMAGSRAVAHLAVEHVPDILGPTVCSKHPGPTYERRLMADMLCMATGQISHPVAVLVLMKPDNRLLHSPPFTPGEKCIESRRLELDIRLRPRPPEPRIHGDRLVRTPLCAQALCQAKQGPRVFRRLLEILTKDRFGVHRAAGCQERAAAI